MFNMVIMYTMIKQHMKKKHDQQMNHDLYAI